MSVRPTTASADRPPSRMSRSTRGRWRPGRGCGWESTPIRRRARGDPMLAGRSAPAGLHGGTGARPPPCRPGTGPLACTARACVAPQDLLDGEVAGVGRNPRTCAPGISTSSAAHGAEAWSWSSGGNLGPPAGGRCIEICALEQPRSVATTPSAGGCADAEVGELASATAGGAAGHRIQARSGLGEGDDLPDVVLAGQDGHQAVDAEGEAAVGGAP